LPKLEWKPQRLCAGQPFLSMLLPSIPFSASQDLSLPKAGSFCLYTPHMSTDFPKSGSAPNHFSQTFRKHCCLLWVDCGSLYSFGSVCCLLLFTLTPVGFLMLPQITWIFIIITLYCWLVSGIEFLCQ
jgi:hypothetical protein